MDVSVLAPVLVREMTGEKEYRKGLDILRTSGANAPRLFDYLQSVIPSRAEFHRKLDLGSTLQRSLDDARRKELAANYTTAPGVELILRLCEDDEVLSIADPFCGSGRLLSSYLSNRTGDLPEVFINDIMPDAVLLAFYEVYMIFKDRGEDYRKIFADIGDAMLWEPHKRIDLFLTNPPFTRTHYLGPEQQSSLKELGATYGTYISGQPGLHIYSLFKIHGLMSSGGKIVTVLPATTICSNYSRGYERFLLENFHQISFHIPSDLKGFSEDSDFRELIMSATLGGGEDNVVFSQIQTIYGRSEELHRNLIQREKLDDIQNWTKFFHHPEILKFADTLESHPFIQSPETLGYRIKRGVEMYGPDFFFLPNKVWGITRETPQELIVSSEHESLVIPKNYLQKILRKPALYAGQIVPHCNEYAIKLPRNVPEWFRTYLSVTSGYATSAQKRFGKHWYTHIQDQLRVKSPFSHLFLIDKFGISTSTVMCHYSPIKLACTKNFYFFKDLDLEESQLLAAWMSTPIYLFLFLVNRREIGGSYGRMQISDLMHAQQLIDTSQIMGRSELLHTFDKLCHVDLPSIPEQISQDMTKDLSQLFLNELGLDGSYDLLIELVKKLLKDVARRDGSFA